MGFWDIVLEKLRQLVRLFRHYIVTTVQVFTILNFHIEVIAGALSFELGLELVIQRAAILKSDPSDPRRNGHNRSGEGNDNNAYS